MQQKFECLHCKHVFMADDHEGAIVCPQCKSDNVQPARFRIPLKAWIAGLCVIVCIAIAFLLISKCNTSEPPVPVTPQQPFVNPEDTTTELTQEDIDILKEDSCELANILVKPELTGGKPEFSNGYYTYSVSVKNAPQTEYEIVLLDHRDNKRIVARSKDGRFEDVPFSEPDGLYDMAVADASSGELLCDPIPTGGFVKQEQASRQLSKDELQQWLNMDDDHNPLMGQNEFVSPDCKIIGAGDVKTLFDVNLRVIEGRWSAVTVVSVSYDNLNRISSVSLQVEQ